MFVALLSRRATFLLFKKHLHLSFDHIVTTRLFSVLITQTALFFKGEGEGGKQIALLAGLQSDFRGLVACARVPEPFSSRGFTKLLFISGCSAAGRAWLKIPLWRVLVTEAICC